MAPTTDEAKALIDVANTAANHRIKPHWLPSNTRFWYRTASSEYKIVDVNLKSVKPAFDHHQLARKLSETTGDEVKEQELPFSHIRIDADDNDSVLFRHKGQTWTFSNDGHLEPSTEDVFEGELQPMKRAEASQHGGGRVNVTFDNRLDSTVEYLWIDWQGQRRSYGKIPAGTRRNQSTFAKHVWCIVDDESRKCLAIFNADEEDAVAVIEKSLPPIADNDAEVDDSERHRGDEPEQIEPNTCVFVRDYNLWHKQGEENVQLSENGTVENPYDEGKIFEAPRGKFVVAWQYVPEQKHMIHLIESSPKDQLQPKLHSKQYLKPGDRVQIDRPRLFDLTVNKEVASDNAMFSNPYALRSIGWNREGNEYRFFYNERGHQLGRVIGLNAAGAVRVIIEESSETFIDYCDSGKTYHKFLADTNELIWTSERDGRNHLYLYDLSSGLEKRCITEGNIIVREVEHIDVEKRLIWYKALNVHSEQDPYYVHLVRNSLDCAEPLVLTRGDGNHAISFSPDRGVFLDTWSRVDQASRTVLRDAETGDEVVSLAEGDMSALLQLNWTIPERFTAPGRDGETLIYGILIKPRDFDEHKTYPVIEDIYAGPQDFHVPKSFSLMRDGHALADLGFIVVKIDGMGTNWRTKSFHDVCYKNLKDSGLPDRIAWIKAAARDRPYLDLDKVGICGVSAGGQNALAALLHYPEFYKVGIADCGCHDNRMDKLWWNEQWMGWPVDESYAENSNVTHAHKLQGKLMLMVGELDDNVDPASTMQVVNALHKAEKEHELVVIPGAGHGAGSIKYGLKLQRRFLQRHLIG